MIDALVEPASVKDEQPGQRAGRKPPDPGDIEEIRDLIEGFGLTPVIAARSVRLAGRRHARRFQATTMGGMTRPRCRAMGAAVLTLVIGEQMRKPAEALESKTGVPFKLFDRLVGLEAVDDLHQDPGGASAASRCRHASAASASIWSMGCWTAISTSAASGSRWRWSRTCSTPTARCCRKWAARSQRAVAPTQSAILEKIRAWSLLVGDHEDFETLSRGADLVVSNSHARMAVSRSGDPVGPGAVSRRSTAFGRGIGWSLGYRGTTAPAVRDRQHLPGQRPRTFKP